MRQRTARRGPVGGDASQKRNHRAVNWGFEEMAGSARPTSFWANTRFAPTEKNSFDGELVYEMRHINGTKRHKLGVKTGKRRRQIGIKVRNISNFCEQCCGNYFCGGTISPPKGPDFRGNLVKKVSKIEQKRPDNQKNRGILVTWRLD